MANGQTRVEEIEDVDHDRRPRWLAGQIDGVEADLSAELRATRAVLVKIAYLVGGIFLTTLGSLLTFVITNALGG